MDNKALRSFGINDKLFHLIFTLEQDEILAPIVYEMFQELTDVFSRSSKSLINIASDNGEQKETILNEAVSVAIDMTKIKAWILQKRYARRLLAVLLVPAGEKFDESKILEREDFFKKNATPELTDEVISFFLSSSSIFGKNTQTSSASVEKVSIRKKR
ncbi:MAG: hypothetical protein Q8L88_02230 [Bacteroidota bacterium]|nr:hypothetical protein [Bacteroidota bacterium]